MTSQRLTKSIFRCPMTAVQSGPNSLNSNSKMLAQFNHTSRGTSNRKSSIIPLVASLLLGCFPTAVGGLVDSIIINSAQCFVFWPRSHILQEQPEITPSLTNVDSPTSVIMELFSSRIVATTQHVCPNVVNLAVFTMPRMAMFKKCSIINRLSDTATRSASSAGQITESESFKLTASATTYDTSNELATWRNDGHIFRNDFKLSKPQADSIDFGRHGIGSFSALFSSALRVTPDACCDCINDLFEHNPKPGMDDMSLKE